MKKKFSKAFIHMGAGKTGSTAIQGAFKNSSSELLKSGLVAYYPDEAHSELGSYFSKCPEKYIFNTIWHPEDTRSTLQRNSQKFINSLKQWIQNIPSCHYLIFSCESFSTLNADEMLKFKKFVNNYTDIVAVIYYVRSPLSFSISAMSQNVKQGTIWSDSFPPIEQYKYYIENMISIFGKEHINIRNFSSIPESGLGVISDFTKTIGLSVDVTQDYFKNDTNEVSNKSLTNNALDIGLSIIKTLSDSGVAYNNEGEFYLSFSRYLSDIPGGSIKLSQNMVKNVIFHSSKHSNFLEKEFNIFFDEKVEEYIKPMDNCLYDRDKLLASIGKIAGEIIVANRNKEMSQGYMEVNNIPTIFNCNELVTVTVTVFNISKYKWVKKELEPISLSYHWKNKFGGKVYFFDGVRTEFPDNNILPNESFTMEMNVKAPSVKGNYILELTIVRDGMYWFEEMGFKSLNSNVEIR